MGVFFSNFSCDTSGLFFSVKLCVFSVKLRVIAPDALVITQRATKETQRHTDFLAKHSHEKLLSLLYLFHIPTFIHWFETSGDTIPLFFSGEWGWRGRRFLWLK